MARLKRVALVVLLGGAMLWIAWLEIGEGVALSSSWPWGVAAALILSWELWAEVNTDDKRPSLLTRAMDAYQP